MKKEQLILIGGGGHCRSCIEVIESEGHYEIVGILDNHLSENDRLFNYPVLGGDDKIAQYAGSCEFLITVGQIGLPAVRRKIADLIHEAGGVMATVVAKTAVVSEYARIGKGTIIMHHAIVNAGAVVGINGIINSRALVEHDCVIGDYCHISTGALINGGVRIGDDSFIGSGAVVVHEAVIESGGFVKAASLFK